MKTSSFEKRVKRQVSARFQAFFIATAPGLEKICFDELRALPLSLKEVAIVEGGIEFKGYVQDCYLANLHLRTASRILMRISSFHATNFRQLKRKLSAIPWELFLQNNQIPEIRVSTRHCRIYHKDAVADHVRESIIERFQSACGLPATKECSYPQQLFVRAADDHFTLSINSSGELLYKRGLKKHGGRAPIRETLAAAALILADYDPAKPLVDPMCGTGTFSLEAALIARNIPPGWYRDFAFMEWPCFRMSRWQYIRRESEKLFKIVHRPLIFASDKDPAVSASLAETIRNLNLSEIINVSTRDFFSLLPTEIGMPHLAGSPQKKGPDQTGLVIINPPYGLRLGTKKDSQKLFRQIVQKLQRSFKGWKAALIAPDKHLINAVPFNVKAYSLFHGGLKLTLLVGRIE